MDLTEVLLAHGTVIKKKKKNPKTTLIRQRLILQLKKAVSLVPKNVYEGTHVGTTIAPNSFVWDW